MSDQPAQQDHTNDYPIMDNWGRRRRVLMIALVWMGLMMTGIVVRGGDTALAGQAFIALAGCFASCLIAYIFGAVWDDHNKRESENQYYQYSPRVSDPSGPPTMIRPIDTSKSWRPATNP